ncbi:uncharacterized protein DDB_G0283697-like [Hydractinia symbiolongicarpus]|uniref:uncharacterized protein DDB_G0283697-like n=1 Tax=Hydractinia symbiolongicarpus TaxID=13093 RepID=UPI0025505257|nr:uncharacterized protein DDB_G0283697-like [Hydractinia symbiolongicarpus]
MQLASCLLIFFIANTVKLRHCVNTPEVGLRRHERDMKLDPNQRGLYIDYGYSESPIGSLPPQGIFESPQPNQPPARRTYEKKHRSMVRRKKRHGMRRLTAGFRGDSDDDDEDEDEDDDYNDNDDEDDDEGEDEYKAGKRAYMLQMRRMQMERAMERNALGNEVMRTKALANSHITSLQMHNMILKNELQQYTAAKQMVDHMDNENEPRIKSEFQNMIDRDELHRVALANSHEQNINVDTSMLNHDRSILASKAQELSIASHQNDINQEITNKLDELYQTPNHQSFQGYEQIQPNSYSENIHGPQFSSNTASQMSTLGSVLNNQIPTNNIQNRQQSGVMYPPVIPYHNDPNSMEGTQRNILGQPSYIDNSGLHLQAQLGLLENSASKAQNLYNIFYKNDQSVVGNTLEGHQLNNIDFDYPPQEPLNNGGMDTLALANSDVSPSFRHKIHHRKAKTHKKKMFSLDKVLKSISPPSKPNLFIEPNEVKTRNNANKMSELPIAIQNKTNIDLSNKTHPLTNAIKKIDDLVDTLVTMDTKQRSLQADAKQDKEKDSKDIQRVTANTFDLLDTLMTINPHKKSKGNLHNLTGENSYPSVVINNSSININPLPQNKEKNANKKHEAETRTKENGENMESLTPNEGSGLEKATGDLIKSSEDAYTPNLNNDSQLNNHTGDLSNKPILSISTQLGPTNKNLKVLTQIYDKDLENTKLETKDKNAQPETKNEFPKHDEVETTSETLLKKQESVRKKAVQAYMMREKIKQNFKNYKDLVSEVKKESKSIGEIEPQSKFVSNYLENEPVIGSKKSYKTQKKLKPNQNTWVLNVDQEDEHRK